VNDEVPKDHPRSASLNERHKIIEGMHKKIVAEAGLIAHGRGEAFDYLIGEETHDFAIEAIEAATAELYLAKKPVLSVNGNVTVLCPQEMVEFSNLSRIPLEINLFYRKPGRVEAIKQYLDEYNPHLLLGIDPNYFDESEEISSQRRFVDLRGIGQADVVFVPLEDDDRTEGLVNEGKRVITVDLNPLSRTAQKAHITIVDNIVRVFPKMIESYKNMNEEKATKILNGYDNKEIINRSLKCISNYWLEKT